MRARSFGNALVLSLMVWISACADDAAGPLDAGAHDANAPDEDASMLDASDLDGAQVDEDASEPLADAALDAADTDADAADDDQEPPQLVASSPSDGDDNLALNAPIALVFSEPVVLGDGAVELRQTDPARVLDASIAQSDDGMRVELTLDAVPELPAALALELSAAITDRSGNPLEPQVLHFTAPVWQRLGGAVASAASSDATDVKLAIDAAGRVVLLRVADGDVHASRWQGDAWIELGGALNGGTVAASPGAEPRIALAIGDDGEPLAAFREDGSVRVLAWNGAEWQSVGDTLDSSGGGSYAPGLALDADGAPVVAFDALDGAEPRLRVRALQSNSWQTLADLDVDARGVRLERAQTGQLTLAYQESGTGIVVSRWDGGSAFAQLGASAALPAVSGSFALSASGAEGCTLTAQGQGTVEWASSAWSALPEDMGLLVSSQAADRVIAHDASGALYAAFTETPAGVDHAVAYVQRLRDGGERFQPLGPGLNREPGASAAQPALALGEGGEPIAAWLETPPQGGDARIFVSRWNGDPSAPPHGLRERSFDEDCLATPPLDGSALADTGCFEDALGVQPVKGFIPFDVRSPLWSDGAFKRRFVMLPEGSSITYRDPGIWTLPPGAIVMKEFSIEARRGDPTTLRPVETRFLIVRDGGTWDRYSYEWNQSASANALREAAPATSVTTFMIEDESGVAATHDHFYPSRAACLSCHQTPGTVLGLQTVMLNRNLDYGTTVDNQLRALQELGVFADSIANGDLDAATFMPNPSDTTYPLERRLRAYLHANCTSCHHPEGGMDLRIQFQTIDTGLCTKIVQGDLDASVIYWRDVLRGNIGQPGVAPMPPLGTLVTNPQLESLLTDWILDPSNVCP